MSFSTINTLRKAGALDEAYELALKEYELTPDDIWIRRALGWVIYSKIKLEPTIDASQLIDYLQSIRNLHFNEEEEVFFSSLAFAVGKVLFCFSKNAKSIDGDAISRIWDLIRKMPFKKPSDGYSFLAKGFYALHNEWPRFLDFCDDWGWENLQESDYKSDSFEGKQYMSFAEKLMIAYSKKLLAHITENHIIPTDRIRSFIRLLEKQGEAHPEYQYTDYYLARLYLATGDLLEATEAFLPFARKKKSEFWVWDLLSELYKEDYEKRKMALCKASLCKTKPIFLVKIRRKLIELLLAENKYAFARYEFEKLKEAYLKENIKIPFDLQRLDDPKSFNGMSAENDQAYLKQQSLLADSLLYDACWELVAVVAGIDLHASRAFLIASDNSRLKLKDISDSLRIGNLLKLRVAKESDNGKTTILSYDKYALFEYPQLIEKDKAVFKLSASGEFGFLGNVFVPKGAIREFALSDRQSYEFYKMKSYNKKKDEIGWSLLRINE